jgi:sugar/nucleoside kinase (ribokinase family)
MAVTFRKNGALIVFEPSMQGDQVLFKEALSVSHIVKVSHESWAHREELQPCKANWLIIETLGPEGLRFLSRLPSYNNSEWQHIPSFPVSNYKDAAGSGDWCTAGFIACLGSQGAEGMKQIGQGQLIDALRQGQLLASWNCGFQGARGGMYSLCGEQLKDLVLGIFSNPLLLRLKPQRIRSNSLLEPQQNIRRKGQCIGELCHLL